MPDTTIQQPAHLFGAEGKAEARVNDLLVEGALTTLRQYGALPPGAPVELSGYHRAAARIGDHFEVELSSITTRMARLLYGITAVAAPSSMLCVGSAWGNALAWMAAAIPGATVLGVDFDPAATAIAAANFRRAGLAADWLIADGRALDVLRGNQFDLVLLDADDPVTRKGILAELLPALRPLLAESALVLAHDCCHPKFADDFVAYRAALHDTLRAKVSVRMPIDRYGLEVTRL